MLGTILLVLLILMLLGAWPTWISRKRFALNKGFEQIHAFNTIVHRGAK